LSTASSPRPRWQLGLLAALVPLALLFAVDLGLRAVSLVPPEHPLVFYARSHETHFSPFVATGRGTLEIRPDWVAPRDGLHRRRSFGRRAGRQFLYPGFRPVEITEQRPEGALRVVVLGGSTTFGLYVGAEAAFAARLEDGLRAGSGEREIEVINLGCPGWATDRILNALDAVLALEPDLLLMYTGHNEMLEGWVGSVPGLTPATRLRAALLRASTLFAWLDYALSASLRRVEQEMSFEEMAAVRVGNIPTFDPRGVPEGELEPPGPDFVRYTVERYAANVARIIERARRAGVPLLFVLPVANLLDPPTISLHAPGFEAVDEFEAELGKAREALGQGRLDAGLRALEQATALSSGHAMAHYRYASALKRAGRTPEARIEYQRALDLDVRTHRITSAHEAAVIEVLQALDADWVDLRPLFHEDLDRERARRLFVDHLHPTELGHERIAARLEPEAGRLLGLAPGAGEGRGQ
jgi:lysophospholipase L1-like esterase